MARPFAHLEAIQMRLDLGIFLPKAWSHPCAPHPAPQRKEIAHSVLPGCCWQNGMGPSDAGGTLGSIASLLLLLCSASPGQAAAPSIPSQHLAMPGPGLGTAHMQRCTRLNLSAPEGIKTWRRVQKCQSREMFARLAAEAQKEASDPALGKGWSGKASGRRCALMHGQRPAGEAFGR